MQQNNCVICIGNFDGLHLGHQAIIARAKKLADEQALPLKVLTFEPHPVVILRPNAVPPRLTSPQCKRQLLLDAGADQVVILKPDLALLQLEPRAFIEKLKQDHGPRIIVEGQNFCFGKDRSGDMTALQQLGKDFGIEVESVTSVQCVLADQLMVVVSSSLIRWLLAHGRVADSARCLGRPYRLIAKVVRGQQRGRQLGFPTLNLDMAQLAKCLLPADGVYSGQATLPNGRQVQAAISIGIKPTLGNTARCVEAHLLDFQDDLYDQAVTLTLMRWIRDQQRYPNVDCLRQQLFRDVATISA